MQKFHSLPYYDWDTTWCVWALLISQGFRKFSLFSLLILWLFIHTREENKVALYREKGEHNFPNKQFPLLLCNWLTALFSVIHHFPIIARLWLAITWQLKNKNNNWETQRECSAIEGIWASLGFCSFLNFISISPKMPFFQF